MPIKQWTAGDKILASDLNGNFTRIIGGDGSDGALNVTSGTTTINLGGARVFVKNYSTFNISSGATLDFSNPHPNGTIIIFNVLFDAVIAGTLSLVGVGAAANTNSLYPLDAGNHQGTNAGNHGSSPNKGIGGVVYSLQRLLATQLFKMSIICPGSGGGDGGTGSTGSKGLGGRGGGALRMNVMGAWNFTGTISVAGQAGTAASGGPWSSGSCPPGGGGGGAAGMYHILVGSITANSGTYNISGGLGNSGGTQPGPSGCTFGAGTGGGGGGGGGAITAGEDGTNGGNANGGDGGDGRDGYGETEVYREL